MITKATTRANIHNNSNAGRGQKLSFKELGHRTYNAIGNKANIMDTGNNNTDNYDTGIKKVPTKPHMLTKSSNS